MGSAYTLHSLTHTALEDLQQAFVECGQKPTEGRILAAIVALKLVHDLLVVPETPCTDIDPEEYCCAV